MEPASGDIAEAMAAQYRRRDTALDAQRYSLFDSVALQAHQERQRSMLKLWRKCGRRTLDGCRIVEVGCGSGGNLLDLLRLGAPADGLTGIDLQSERVALARRALPLTVTLLEGDAAVAPIEPASHDVVLAFTVFSSVLDDAGQARLAAAMWSWVRPGGGVLWYDFAFDNPRNPDVRGVSLRRMRALFPDAQCAVRRVTLAPPLARLLGRLHPSLITPMAAVLPFLRTHRLAWATKP